MKNKRGYTLVELIVAIGLFAIVMTLASGAYIMMIGLTERAQGTATGIDNLSFALETMTRSIRTGTGYNCISVGGGDCLGGNSNFYFTNANGISVSYNLGGTAPNQYIQQTVNGVTSPLTDPSVSISSLKFYVYGTKPFSQGGDTMQPHVTMIILGTVAGKTPQYFTVETGATMRGTDL